MKLWAFVSSTLAALFLLAAIFFQVRATGQADHFRQAGDKAALALTRAEEKADAAEKQKAQLDRKVIELDRELAATKARETTLGAQLRQAQLEARQLRGAISDLEAGNQSLEDKLAQFRRELIEAKSRPAVLQGEERQELEREITKLQTQLIALQNSPRHHSPVAVPIDILSISARSDVVALDCGTSSGLNEQSTATLKRDGTAVARLLLHEVRPSISIAHVLEQNPGQTLAKGSGYTLLIEP